MLVAPNVSLKQMTYTQIYTAQIQQKQKLVELASEILIIASSTVRSYAF